MSQLTFKEHLFLMEARKEGVKYTEKQVKNVLDRVTATLAGTEAANMTKLAKRYARLEASMAAMKEKHAELNSRLKGDVADLFNAEEIVLTRVVETAQFTLTMAKEIKKGDGTEVDYASIVTALSALISEELQPRVESIVAKYTKTVPAKDPIKKLSVSKEVVKEGILDSIKGWLKSFVSWAMRYDMKLEKLKEKAGLLNEATEKGFDKFMAKATGTEKAPEKKTLMDTFGSEEYKILKKHGIVFFEKPGYWEDLKGKYEITSVAIEKAEKEIGVPFKIYTQDKVFVGKKSLNSNAINGAMPQSDAKLPKEPVFIVHLKDGSMYLADGTQANSYIRMWARIKS